MGYIGNPLDPWGAADEAIAYRASFEALAASGAYDVLVVVHDNPFRELPSEVDVATTVSRALVDATAGRPELLPVYVSLTSNDASDEVKAFLDAQGGMPMLKGAVEAFAAIARLAAWERAARGPARRRDRGAPAWPALAADRVPWGVDSVLDPLARAAAAPRSRGPARAREPARASPTPGLPVTAWRAVARGARRGRRGLARARRRAGRAQARRAGARPQERCRRRRARADGRGGDRGGGRRRCWPRQRAAGVDAPRPAGRADGRAGVELIVGGRRDAVFGPAVLVGLGGILAEVLDDVAVLLAPVAPRRGRRPARGRCAARRCCAASAARSRVDVGARWRTSWWRSGDLLVADPSIAEIDLNPVIAGPGGVVAVDALVVLEDPAGLTAPRPGSSANGAVAANRAGARRPPGDEGTPADGPPVR